MKYILIIVVIIILIKIAYYFYKNSKNNKDKIVDLKEKNKLKLFNKNNCSSIIINQLPIEKIENYEYMYEITDNDVITHINNLIPELIQVGTTATNAIQASTNVVYEAIIPKGTTLSKSRSMKNALKGIYHGENGVKGHADLVKVKQSGKIVANTVSTGIGITSIIIGQYYMTQINVKLNKINDELSKITRFQNNEYKGKIIALIVQIKRISSFKSEIIENEQLRKLDIDKLNLLEETCIELLGQANEEIIAFTQKDILDYKEYSEELSKIHIWYIYQKTLLEILYKITELKNILYLGKISKEQLSYILEDYTKQVMNVHQLLILWHEKIAQKLKIDIEMSRRKRTGVDGVVHWIPGLFKNDFNFCSISKESITMIEEQSSSYNPIEQYDYREIFNKDVKVISKDGKLYYLPY